MRVELINTGSELLLGFTTNTHLNYIARQLACDALDEQTRPDLRAIGEILAAWLLPLYRPGEAAPISTDVGTSWQRSAQ